MMLPRFADPVFGSEPAHIHFSLRSRQRCTSGTDREDLSHPFGFYQVDHQTPTLRADVIAQHRSASHPFAFPSRGRHLVPRSLTDDLPLELGKRQQDIERQPAHGSAGIELLGD